MREPRPSRALTALNAALVVALFTVAVVFLFVFASPDPFDPITYTPQPRPVERLAEINGGDAVRVTPRVAGYDGPAVRLGETVPTTGLVCNDAERPVNVLADLTWERWDIRGLRVPVLDDFAAIIEPDCTPLEFENPIPNQVAESVRSGGAQQWIITGSATPIEPGGVAATWRIEPFWVVP